MYNQIRDSVIWLDLNKLQTSINDLVDKVVFDL